MSEAKRVVIAGGTGFLGLNLASHLAERGYQVSLLSRHPSAADERWRHFVWDGRSLGEWVVPSAWAESVPW